LLAFGPSLHFARVGVGLRGVVTGNRHGWSIVRLWWFHPVRCFPVAHPRHSPSTLLVISPSSPCCFPVVSPLLPVVVSPSFLVDVSLLSHYSSSTSSHRRLLGRSLLSTRRVCHICPLFPASYCLWRNWAWVIWCQQPSLPVI